MLREPFANNEHYLTLQRRDAPCTVKYNAPQVDHHVVERKYPACLYVRSALPGFGYEQQTTGIVNQCDECDSHHCQRFRDTTECKAYHHLYEYAHRQDKLELAREACIRSRLEHQTDNPMKCRFASLSCKDKINHLVRLPHYFKRHFSHERLSA